MQKVPTPFLITIILLFASVVLFDAFQSTPDVSGNIVANKNQVSLCSLDQTLDDRLITILGLVNTGYIQSIDNVHDPSKKLWAIHAYNPITQMNEHFLYDVGPNSIMGDTSDDKAYLIPSVGKPLQLSSLSNRYYYLSFDAQNQLYIVNSCLLQSSGCTTPQQELILSAQKWWLSTGSFLAPPPAMIVEATQRISLAARTSQGVKFVSCSLNPNAFDACALGEQGLQTHYILSQSPGVLVYTLPNLGFVYSFWSSSTAQSWLYFDAITNKPTTLPPSQIANIQHLQVFTPASSTFLALNLINITPGKYTFDYSFFDPATGQLSPFITNIADDLHPLNFAPIPFLFFDPNDALFGAVFMRSRLDKNRKIIGTELVLRKVGKKENVLGYNFPLGQSLYHISDRQIVSFILDTTYKYTPVAVSCP